MPSPNTLVLAPWLAPERGCLGRMSGQRLHLAWRGVLQEPGPGGGQ